ncbi:hypothetical protein F0Q45_08385 [Mycobacterium simiae]|uniref:DUF4226 domain-containing protein n=1 Tax=Mycobacterium simiae TaxID=1784 RepID=A0A5B1BRM3_MYCSI|nr:hypothetical protein [Mycobacterium simiae]KAA1250702.1 hypothetical protein F0Q45_08385 [Mycobacterium simiae]
MTDSEARKFGDATSWATWNKDNGVVGWSTPGWALPGDPTRYISKDDGVWKAVLFNAQTAYGDPNIHYNTDDTGSQRYLVFGDGTRLPADGTIVYHDAGSGKNWIQNQNGSVTVADKDFKPTGPTFAPLGYRRSADGKMYMPVDARGNQIGPQQPFLTPGTELHGNPADPNAILTPVNKNGDYYTLDPATGRRDFFDKSGKPISETQYQAGAGAPPNGQPPAQQPAPGQKAPLQSTKVNIPDGMTTPQYPQWATDVDPDVPNQMTGVIVRLYELFGSGTPATSKLPEFPFRTDTGERSGIDAYDTVKSDFKRIEAEFDAAATAFKTAVQHSANVTKAGRDAINNAIATFNSTAKTLDEGNWDGLLHAESTLLDTVKTEVENAAKSPQSVPSNPAGGPETPMTQPAPAPGPADPSLTGRPPTDDTTKDDLKDLLGMGSPFGMPMGGNPLGGLGAMNPLGSLGGMNPLGGGGGANPLSPLADAVKPLARLADADTNKADEKKSPITPLNPGPHNTPPPASSNSSGPAPAEPAAAAGPAPGHTGPANQPSATPAGNSGSKPTVTLPDGTVVDAPSKRAADAAQNAIDKASPGGDAAQKAYSPTGLELPGDGKNLGARVDPSDMKPGDVLKWQDKTMVAVAPGLVADPHQPGVVHTLEEVLKDQKGFQGIFDPNATDPTLSTHTSAPPLTDPQAPSHPPGQPPAAQPAPPPADHQPPPSASNSPQAPPTTPVPAEPPPDSVPLSGPGPAAAPAGQQPAPQLSSTVPQAAPPSPFEGAALPPATRTTKHERIAAGME